MCKRSKKPLGKQQKKKRKNRKVREYEKIKMELTNLSPAERRRERILAEAEEKTAINTTPLTISVISMIFSWFAVFQSKIYEILKDWFQTLLEEYSNHAEIIQKIQQKSSGNFMRNKLPKFVAPSYKPYYENMRKTKHFTVDDSCIGCRLCEKMG